MHRFCSSLAAGLLFVAPAAAQACLDVSSPGTFVFAGDELVSGQIPLGLTVPNPVGGALPGGYTHCLVCSNGWILLTDGVSTAGSPGTFEWGSTDADFYGFRGAAGDLPLIAPFWGDADTAGGAGDGIFVKASTGPGVPAEISFVNQVDWGYTTPKSCKVLIHDSGLVQFQYGVGFDVEDLFAFTPRYVGVSARNGIAAVPGQTDLSVGGSDANGLMYQTYFAPGDCDLGGLEITFAPMAGGGWTEVVSCVTPVASTEVVGAGCYTFSETMCEEFGNGVDAAAALTGNMLSWIPTGTGYIGVWVPGGAAAAFVAPPGGATALPVADDGDDTITPSVPFLAPSGSFPDVTISHNGILTLGATANNVGDYEPFVASVAAETGLAFYAWADYRDDNTTPVASGVIKYHEAVVGADTILYVTWDGVDRWSEPQISCPSTWQFQANLTTGQVNIVFLSMNPESSSIFGNTQVVGMTGPGAVADPGSAAVTRQYPLLCEFGSANVLPLTLTASPDPVLDGSGATPPLTWTVTNVPEATQFGPMVRACNIVFSIGPASTFAPGLDLGPLGFDIGAGGCRGYLGSLDAFADVTTVNGTGICTLGPISFGPPPSLIGAIVTTQAIAVFPAGSLPGGVNDIGGGNGLVTSNAIRQVYNPL